MTTSEIDRQALADRFEAYVDAFDREAADTAILSERPDLWDQVVEVEIGDLREAIAALRASAGGGSAGAEAMRAENERLRDRVDELEEALFRVKQWSEAYPLAIFPEPDFEKAAALLEAGGMTLDGISASCMRRVVEGVGKIARAALSTDTDPPGSPDADGTEGRR